MSLDVNIRHRQGDFILDVQFRSDGRLTALFGRSGAGKTSIVNAIGGLIRPHVGQIVVNERVLFDSRERIDVPKHRRGIGYVFQEGRLFPHLDVRQNLLFGRFFAPRSRRATQLDDVVSLLGIESLLHRRPGTLSGGEKQRVAIGRALMTDPDLLLMDEPLASLDEERKAEIYPYVERLRDEGRVPIVFVTHSVAEIARLATVIVVLANGKVAAHGAAADVLGNPLYFPQFGTLEAGVLIDTRILSHDKRFKLTVLQSRSGNLTVPLIDKPAGSFVRVRLRARDVLISLGEPKQLSALNILSGRVVALQEADGGVDVTLDCGGDHVVARLTRKSIHDLAVKPGLSVYVVIKGIALEG